jgi:hypothetical protein
MFRQGHRFLCLPALLLLACQDAPPISIYGEWVIAEYRSPGPSSMTKSEAERFTGLRLSYSADQASMLDRSCDHPNYRRWKLSPRHFESDYGVRPQQVGIQADSIEVVHVDCAIGGRAAETEILILSPDRLILTTGGVFFLLTRVAT